MAVITKQERNISDYIVVCISEFAANHGLKMQDAYKFLQKNKGIDYLQEFYDVEHTLSFEDTMEALDIICSKNGGTIEHRH